MANWNSPFYRRRIHNVMFDVVGRTGKNTIINWVWGSRFRPVAILVVVFHHSFVGKSANCRGMMVTWRRRLKVSCRARSGTQQFWKKSWHHVKCLDRSAEQRNANPIPGSPAGCNEGEVGAGVEELVLWSRRLKWTGMPCGTRS